MSEDKIPMPEELKTTDAEANSEESSQDVAYLRSCASIDPEMVLRVTSQKASDLQFKDAIELFLLLTQFDAVKKHAWMNLANIYLMHADFEKAMDAAQRSMDAGGQKERYLHEVISKTFLGLDDLNNAIKHAMIAQAIEPDNKDLLAYRTELLGFKNQFKEFLQFPAHKKNTLYFSNLPWIGEAGPKFGLEEILGNWEGIITQPVMTGDIGQLKQQHYECLQYSHRVWKGESLDNRTILIYSDQGMGDNIWLLGHVKRLKERYPTSTIIMAGYAVLHPILKKCEYIDRVYYPVFELSQLAEVDYFCGIFNLLEFLPYEYDGPFAPVFDSPKLPDTNKKKIVVNWLCNEKNLRLMHRKKVDMDLLSTLLNKYKDSASFFVCQKKEHDDRMQQDIEKYNLPVTSLTCGTMADLFAYIQDADLVLTNDTLHVHVAGALGKDTICMLTKNMTLPFWGRDIEKVPYYGTVRLIRGTEKIPSIEL